MGGSGALGSAVARRFLQNFRVTNIDFSPNAECSDNLILDPTLTPTQSMHVLKKSLKTQTFNSVICTAGGWAGESISSPQIFESVQKMIDMNFMSTLTAAELARENLEQGGIFINTGASLVFKEPCPDMLSYALSKNLVHNLHQILLFDPRFVEKEIHSICILPTVIDNPGNRAGMPDADFSKWLNPEKVAEQLYMWVNSDNLPDNGAFVNLEESNGMIQTTVL